MKCAKCGGNLRVTGRTHRYTESGLPYVVLHGVQVRKCQACGAEEVAIPNIAGLHRIEHCPQRADEVTQGNCRDATMHKYEWAGWRFALKHRYEE